VVFVVAIVVCSVASCTVVVAVVVCSVVIAAVVVCSSVQSHSTVAVVPLESKELCGTTRLTAGLLRDPERGVAVLLLIMVIIDFD
jgi:hypothetical protein